MNEAYLNLIRESIRKNWGKVQPFRKLPKNHFNCYMFAVCSTVPTEILVDDNTLQSMVCENGSYFGSIGRFSGTQYRNAKELKQALINDLDVLVIKAEETSEDYLPSILDRKTILIAFYSNYISGMFRKHEQFHFLRYIPHKGEWMGKEGFPGGFQNLGHGTKIGTVNVINQNRIGIFKLQLK